MPTILVTLSKLDQRHEMRRRFSSALQTEDAE